MAKLSFRLAKRSDGETLKALIAEIEMQSNIANTALFVEDFWRDIAWASDDVYVLVCEKDAEMIGFGSIVVYTMWLAGKVQKLAYLTQLRLKPEHRGGSALVRAYRFLDEVRKGVDATYFFTSILDSNQRARAVLTGGRAGLPEYRPLLAYRTYVLRLGKRGQVVQSGPLEEKPRDLNLVDWASVNDTETYELVIGGAKIGVTTNPSKKATLIKSYASPLGGLRPLYNATRSLHRRLYLPPPGHTLPMHYVTQCRYESPGKLLELLSGLGKVLPGAYLALGLASSHAHNAYLKKRSAMTLSSTIYQVMWPDSPPLKLSSNPALSVALL